DAWARRVGPDVIICNSAYTAGAHRALGLLGRTEILHCPVALPHVDASARSAIRATLDTPPDAIVIVQASRVTPGKGHEMLLHALMRLADIPSWVHWQVGGVQQRAEQEYAEQLQTM